MRLIKKYANYEYILAFTASCIMLITYLKNMKRFCFIIILSVIYANVFAGAIQGRIVDKSSRVPLEFAQLSLLQLSDKKLVAGTTTGLNGVFELKGVADGRYLLKCSLCMALDCFDLLPLLRILRYLVLPICYLCICQCSLVEYFQV